MSLQRGRGRRDSNQPALHPGDTVTILPMSPISLIYPRRIQGFCGKKVCSMTLNDTSSGSRSALVSVFCGCRSGLVALLLYSLGMQAVRACSGAPRWHGPLSVGYLRGAPSRVQAVHLKASGGASVQVCARRRGNTGNAIPCQP